MVEVVSLRFAFVLFLHVSMLCCIRCVVCVCLVSMCFFYVVLFNALFSARCLFDVELFVLVLFFVFVIVVVFCLCCVFVVCVVCCLFLVGLVRS